MDYHKLLEYKEKVNKRMDELILLDNFEISKKYIKGIHKYLFKDIMPNNGNYRYYNIKRDEIILNEHSVLYEDYNTIDTYLNMEIERIKKVDFDNLSYEEKIRHIVDTTINLWIIHPFTDGNTRTITLFIEKYLMYLGYEINHLYFRKNANYFRNAIVKAVYENSDYGVLPDILPLTIFFRNVMNNESIMLSRENLIVKEMFESPVNKGKIRVKKTNK